ncbi:hypothetical protein glysoja_028184 [Glycine soja]|uniref:Uncharacterized protein n=1 Tax=Glycine soja TaxID=3848 RepID=A0A0B2QQP8_GLYSO|nr:hypothetical protein glysoja_028184 [Glycine soja]
MEPHGRLLIESNFTYSEVDCKESGADTTKRVLSGYRR